MVRSDNPTTLALAEKLNGDMSLEEASHFLGLTDIRVRLHFNNAIKHGYLTTKAISKTTTAEQNPFPDDLEGKIRATVSSLDGVLKIATLLSLTPQPQSSVSIRRSIEKRFDIELANSASIGSYCGHSFVPRGISNARTIDLDGKTYTYFASSSEGAEFVQPIAAYTIHFLGGIGVMPRELFGRGNSPNQNSRGPYNALKILLELYNSSNNDRTTCPIIGGKIGLKEGLVMQHLKRLENAGLCSRFSTFITSPEREYGFILTQKGKSVIEYMQNVTACFTDSHTRAWMTSFYSTLFAGTSNSGESRQFRSSFAAMLSAEEAERKAGHRGVQRSGNDRTRIVSYVAGFEGDTPGPSVTQVAQYVGTTNHIARRLIGDLVDEGSICTKRVGNKTISFLTP